MALVDEEFHARDAKKSRKGAKKYNQGICGEGR